MPHFAADAPLSYYEIPEDQRDARCRLGSDDCVVDGTAYFVRGAIEIPVHGEDELFVWGVWVSLSKASFTKWGECFHAEHRSHIGPFFGWLDAWLKPYPDTRNLKTRVHLRDHGLRPYFEIEPTDHPLAVAQREGISVARVSEIYAQMVHDKAV